MLKKSLTSETIHRIASLPKDIPDEKDLSGFVEELQDQTDRATVIIGAAYLEELLGDILRAFFVDEKKIVDELLRGPLGTYSSRVSACYCFGLIGPDMKDDLEIIRTIRNPFAHQIHGLSFSTPKIRSRCMNLRLKKLMRKPANAPKHPRDVFIFSVVMLACHLRIRWMEAKRIKREIGEDFEHS